MKIIEKPVNKSSRPDERGVNRDVLRSMFGKEQELNLFKPPKLERGTGDPMKMTRILVWPNVTWNVNELEKDSFIKTIYNMIKGLNQLGRFDLWWEIVLPLTDVKDGKKQPFWLFNPQPGEKDQFPNVEIIQVKWPSSTITTRGHFDKFSLNTAFVNKDNRNDDDDYHYESQEDPEDDELYESHNIGTSVKRIRSTTIGKTKDEGFKTAWQYYEDEVNWNFKDIDLIFSHLPDTTWNLMSYLGNEWHHTPPVLGYSHWFDVPQVCNWNYPNFIRQCEGISLMEKCYVNTDSQKKLVMEHAESHFSKSFLDKIDSKTERFHLPVLDEQVVDDINDKPFKTIVFNHRTKTYKDFKNFILKVCDPLWKKRQDFKVWLPLLDAAQMKDVGDYTWEERMVDNGGYIDKTKYDKDEHYLNYLSKCCVGYSPPQKYNGWSVATTDGLMVGVPYVMYDADYYHELNPTAEYFTNYEHAIVLLEKYLDDTSHRNSHARSGLKHVKDNLLWSSACKELSKDIDEVVESATSDAPAYRPDKSGRYGEGMENLLADIKKYGELTKRELITQRWGSGIKFTQYRRALMNHPNIKDKNQSISTYVWVDEKNKKK
tara:strand:- start:27 stop:1826 length:1800 start_codon:yes stop_codon:yes gene_type:complete